MIAKLIAAAALLPALALAGCATSAKATPEPRKLATIAPAAPASAPWQKRPPAAEGIVDTVLVDVYPGTVFHAAHGCRCTVPGGTAQLFPAGTPVVLVKIMLTGYWKMSQGDARTQDVTGMSLSGTKFDGRPEPAVLDAADGPAAARKAGLPWLPAGLFQGRAWRIPNQRGSSFAAAWYLPPGVDHLELTVDVPIEGSPNVLDVPLPASVVSTSTASGE